MIKDKYINKISTSLLPIELIRPYPKASNREKWVNIDNEVKALIISRAKKYENTKLKPLKGTLILDSFSSGNLKECIDIFDTKINALIALTLGECVDNNNIYTEKILDVAWSIFDMAIWYLPEKSDSSAFDISKNILDDYSTKFGFVLTYSYLLLKEQFDKIDINIGKRFNYEIKRRIMRPFMNNESSVSKSNINNIILPFLIFEDDFNIRHGAIKKVMELIDSDLMQSKDNITYDSFSLMNILETLYMASGGVFDVFGEESIRDIGDIAKSTYETEHDDGIVSIIKFANYTNNNSLMKFAYSQSTIEDIINLLNKDISFDNSLFIIFNKELIKNKFYIL